MKKSLIEWKVDIKYKVDNHKVNEFLWLSNDIKSKFVDFLSEHIAILTTHWINELNKDEENAKEVFKAIKYYANLQAYLQEIINEKKEDWLW